MTAFDPFAIAALLTDCICPQLKDVSRGEQAWAGECCIFPGPGPVPWENCCDTGAQMTITILPGFPTTTFPNQDARAVTGCGARSQAVPFEITVLRCVCIASDDEGTPCTCAQREQDAANLLGDLKAVLAGISCCFQSDDFEDTSWILNGWRLLAPAGGCAGVVATVTVELDSPCCTPLTPPSEED